VTIVNAPTIDELAAIRPRSTDATPTDTAGSTDGTPTSTVDERPTTRVSVETTGNTANDGGVPGFGVLAAALALLIAIAAAFARRLVRE